MAGSRPDNWFAIGWDTWMLGAEAALVIGLRSATLALGGANAHREARRMVIEKAEAGAMLGMALATGRLGSSAETVSRRTLAHYRRRVRANRKRLSGR